MSPHTISQKNSCLSGAYYLNAHMYSSVPKHVRADMEWIAEAGSAFVCVNILEQDLWAAGENIDLILSEAARVDLRVLAVPSRWAGLTAGAPKVPSLFSVLHPHTWVQDAYGRTNVDPMTCGVMSSIHCAETGRFFRESLDRLFLRHPALAGLVIDEPKALQFSDYSPKAALALGRDAPRSAHVQAAVAFYDEVLRCVGARYPDKLRCMFLPAQSDPEDLERCAAMQNIHYFGADGRAWDRQADLRWKTLSANSESGRGKILLDGVGRRFIGAARRHGKKSLFLIENHNLTEDMVSAMDRFLPEVLGQDANLILYYYYPRNVPDPERAMQLIRHHLREAGIGFA